MLIVIAQNEANIRLIISKFYRLLLQLLERIVRNVRAGDASPTKVQQRFICLAYTLYRNTIEFDYVTHFPVN